VADPDYYILHGHETFVGPCVHGRDPWTRCDECGEGNAVEALMKRVAALEAERDEARKAYAAAHEELRRTADMLAAARDVANRQRAAGEAADAESAREIEARIVRPLRSERDALAAALRIANKALVAHGAAPVAGAPTAAPAKEEP
jgi:flagellar biosynthesis regulator FlaF